MSSWAQMSLQDPLSLKMFLLTSFHNLILMVMVMVISMISYMILFLMTNKFYNRYLMEAHVIELIWTLVPGIILLILAIPSLKLLYLMDELNNPKLTIKITGHQWYWSYEYGDFPYISFDSFMLPTKMLKNGQYRLLETDNHLIIPMNTEIRLLITASDVIHSWTVPTLGVKIDAIPGRLNQLSFISNRTGVFYGQCSEICGANHSFMPITIELINMKSFISWTNTMKM